MVPHKVVGSWSSIRQFSSSHPTPVLQMRVGMARFSSARRMLANGGGSSLGMNSPASSCRRPLLGAEESECLLQEFGEPGHWSACSLANRRGGLPASGSLLGLLSAPTRRLGGGVPFPAAGVSLLLCVLLAVAAPPRSRVGSSRVTDAEPQIRCLIFQLWLEGCTAQCCAPWQWETVKGSSLIMQDGLAARTSLRASEADD